jgi:hypothetical protein
MGTAVPESDEDFIARVRASQQPRNLNEDQLRARIARCRVDADRRQAAIDYHSQRRDGLLDEMEECRNELRERYGDER